MSKRIDVRAGDEFFAGSDLWQRRGSDARVITWEEVTAWEPRYGICATSIPRDRALAALKAMGYEIDETPEVPVVPVPEYAVYAKSTLMLIYFGTADACHALMDRVLKSSSDYTVVRLDWAGWFDAMLRERERGGK